MQQTYRDAEDIVNEDFLLRRITPSQHTNVLPDGRRILTSFAFREPSHQCSMYAAKEVTHAKVLSCGHPTQEIVEVKAGEVRDLGYAVVRDPDECDASHVYTQAKSYKSRGQISKDCKVLAELVNARIAAKTGIGPEPSR